jgi:hypothetical protein
MGLYFCTYANSACHANSVVSRPIIWPMGCCHVGLALLLRSSHANGVAFWTCYANSVSHANGVVLHGLLRSRYAISVPFWSDYANSVAYANSVFFTSAPDFTLQVRHWRTLLTLGFSSSR